MQAAVSWTRVRAIVVVCSVAAFTLMPLSMAEGGAQAMGHAMSPMSHASSNHEKARSVMDCHGQSAPDERHGDDMRLSCAIACSLMVPSLPHAAVSMPIRAATPVAALTPSLAGIAPELEAPPPKSLK